MINYQENIARIEELYRPKNDVAFPRVSHVEKALLEMIKDLLDRVDDLERAAALIESTELNGEY